MLTPNRCGTDDNDRDIGAPQIRELSIRYHSLRTGGEFLGTDAPDVAICNADQSIERTSASGTRSLRGLEEGGGAVLLTGRKISRQGANKQVSLVASSYLALSCVCEFAESTTTGDELSRAMHAADGRNYRQHATPSRNAFSSTCCSSSCSGEAVESNVISTKS